MVRKMIGSRDYAMCCLLLAWMEGIKINSLSNLNLQTASKTIFLQRSDRL